jgi:predicted SAM-dependent methyltransferase
MLTSSAVVPVATSPRLLVNLGAGPRESAWVPPFFAGWRQLRVDLDPSVAPDLLADVTDLSAIETGSADAVWSSHCLEHLFAHQVGQAIAEAFRVLKDDGFLCLVVPDLQSIAEYLAADKLHEVVYESPAGPVTAHDIIYGFAPYIAQGMHRMGHRCGFTPALLLNRLQEVPFAEIVMRRRAGQELAAIARKRAPSSDAERDAFMAALEL